MARWNVFAVSLFALAMSLIFSISAFSLPPGNAALPAALTFLGIAMLGNAVFMGLKDQDKRLRRLEQQQQVVESKN